MYEDIIDLPHHVSGQHPRMSMMDRVAQLSPFTALRATMRLECPFGRNRQTRCSRRATASAVAQVKSGYLFALHSASVWAGISFSAQASSAVCANLGARSRTHSK